VCTHLAHKITDYGIYNNHLRVLCSALIQILISIGQESHPIDKNQSVHQYLVAQSCAQKSKIKTQDYSTITWLQRGIGS
jgi:hypothetical protein